MISSSSHGAVGLLLSGGLDSAVLLGLLVDQRCRVQPIYVRSGLIWEDEEHDAVQRFLHALPSPLVDPLVVLDLPADDLYGDHWSITGRDVPDDCSPDDAVYLHGRNALLIVKAGLWCQLHGVRELALGVLSTNPFADASLRFFQDLQSALNCGREHPIRIRRPLANMTKRQVMGLGRAFPLELTFSCISPADGLHCGRCNKCAERGAAFRLVGMADPTRYALPLVES